MRSLDLTQTPYTSTWQSEFSVAYVLAIASAAGVSCELTRVDIHGVDATLTGDVPDAALDDPKLSLQIKSWTTPDEHDGAFRYPLKAGNYTKLRRRSHVPKILVLVVMPPSRADWMSITDEQAVIRHCAYWRSLEGMPASDNVSTITIDVSKQNQFSAEALGRMMAQIANGGRP